MHKWKKIIVFGIQHQYYKDVNSFYTQTCVCRVPPQNNRLLGYKCECVNYKNLALWRKNKCKNIARRNHVGKF